MKMRKMNLQRWYLRGGAFKSIRQWECVKYDFNLARLVPHLFNLVTADITFQHEHTLTSASKWSPVSFHRSCPSVYACLHTLNVFRTGSPKPGHEQGAGRTPQSCRCWNNFRQV